MSKRAFASGKELLRKLEEYASDCAEKGRFSNTAGFCRACGITRETYYAQKDYYPKEYGVCECVFEDEALNAGVSPTIILSYLKNKCGYKDKPGDEADAVYKIIYEQAPGDME